MNIRKLAMLLPLGALAACAVPAPQQQAVTAAPAPVVRPALPQAAPAAPEQVADDGDSGQTVVGTASWYKTGRRLHRTSSGELLNNKLFTAASSDLPLGTMVRVGLVDDDSRSVVVRVNDRMPHNDRVIDLSEIAAKELGLMGAGVATVTVTPVQVASEP